MRMKILICWKTDSQQYKGEIVDVDLKRVCCICDNTFV